VRPRWQRTTRRDVYTVDVTAFLSLMVILVPFLLVTAVFSRTTILELQPAAGEGAQTAAADPLQLQVVLRDAVIEVNYRGLDQPLTIARSSDRNALESLATLAAELKTDHPGSLEATVLLEPQINYDLLVQVVDTLRVRLRQQGNGIAQQQLFPLIALGPVPVGEQAGPGVL
jgi:biopolymer transport protein ExbD